MRIYKNGDITKEPRVSRLKRICRKNHWIPSIISILAISACNSNGMQEYQDSLPLPKPTKLEKEFVENLNKNGYSDVVLDIPIIGNVGYGTSNYLITMKSNFPLTEKNKDSVESVNKNIAIELFHQVLEDSIKRDIKEINVTFKLENKIKNGKNLYSFSRVYSKEMLSSSISQ